MKTFTKFSLSLLVVFSLLLGNSLGSDKHGTTGKITGKVIDSKDNAPLIGATIKIEGIFSGATADDKGEYTILNLEVGTYTVTVSYAGYDPAKITDVKVSADFTTTLNFSLMASGSNITTEEIEIVGKRNVISPDQSGRIINKEFIENTGIRGIENLAATTAGVVQDERGTAVNIRGGRVNETAVIIDGVLTTNPINGKSTQYVSNNSLEEIAVLTGGFSAEYGNIMSGVINVTTKSGTDRFSGTLEGVTDEVMADDVSQGYNVYNVALGGPLFPTKKLSGFANFFAGYESDFSRVADPSWISDQLELPDNILPDYTLNRWAFNAKLNFDLQELNQKLPVQLKFGTGLTNTERRVFAQSYMMFNSQRNPLIEESSNQYYGKINHQINSNFFYELQFNYFDASYIEGDPQFRGNFYSYGDPDKVIGLEIPGDGIWFDEYNVMAKYNRVRDYYEQSNSSYWGLNLNSTYQLNNNEIKFGGEYKYNTISFLNMNPVGMFNLLGKPASEQLSAFNGAIGSANYFGYVPFYNSATGMLEIQETNSTGFDAPKHPIIAGLYVLDKVEFKDFIMNIGLRWDYLNANSWRVNDLANIIGANGVLGPEDFNYDNVPASQLSPRIGLSFPVTNNTIFHAQYGKFIQMPSFEFLYNGYGNLLNSVDTWLSPNYAYGNPNLKPEKTIAYEIGVKQQIGDKLFIDLTTYYKETEDLIGIQKYPQLPNYVIVFANKDYGTIRGTDLQIDLRRTNRLALNAALGIAFASGTGSDPNSGSTAVWLGTRQPKLTAPLDYDQRFTGVVNADYRFGTNDVPQGFWGDVLSQLGFNLLYNFNSGRPYTQKENTIIPFSPALGSGAASLSTINGVYKPWNNRVDLKVDKTVSAWKLDINFYVYIINLLNSEIINEVWDGSGFPGSTGYLNSAEGQATILAYNNPEGDPPTTSEEFIRRYNLRSKDAGNYGPPRQYRFGIKMNF